MKKTLNQRGMREVMRVLGCLALVCATSAAPARAMSTGAGLAVAGAVGSLAAISSVEHHDASKAALQHNPSLALIEFGAAERELRAGDVDQAMQSLKAASRHDPSGAFAGGEAGVGSFIKAIDAKRHQEQVAEDAANQQAIAWLLGTPIRRWIAVIFAAMFVLTSAGLILAACFEGSRLPD